MQRIEEPGMFSHGSKFEYNSANAWGAIFKLRRDVRVKHGWVVPYYGLSRHLFRIEKHFFGTLGADTLFKLRLVSALY